MFEGMKELHTPGTGAPSVNEGLAAEDELFGHLGESARAVGSTHSPAFTGALATEEELFPPLSPNPALATEEELFPRLSPNPALATEEELFPRLSPNPALATEEELFPRLSPNPALATEEELFPRLSPHPGALATEEELFAHVSEGAKALGSSEIPSLTFGPLAPNIKTGFLDAITAAADDIKNKPSELTNEELLGEVGKSARVASTEIPTLTFGPNVEAVHMDLPQWLQQYPHEMQLNSFEHVPLSAEYRWLQQYPHEMPLNTFEHVPLSAEYRAVWAEDGSVNAWELMRKAFSSTMATLVDWGKLVRIDSGAAFSETPEVLGLGVKDGIGNGVIDKLATEGGSLLRLPEWAETAAKVAETLKIAEL